MVTEIFEKQEDIIRLQGEIIDELFRLLMTHVSATDPEICEITRKIREVRNDYESC